MVTNKWMKAGYGEPLRRFFGERTWVESVVDFGHAKQFFKDADVFPCFLVVRRPNQEPKPSAATACVIPRNMVLIDQLPIQVSSRGVPIDLDCLAHGQWSLEPKRVSELMAKLIRSGTPLTEYLGSRPLAGFATGLNEAFVIDGRTRDSIIRDDPRSAEILKPYLRGQDLDRWSASHEGLWLIFTRRGIDIGSYPAIKKHLEQFRARLEPRPESWAGDSWPGRKGGSYNWYEIQDSVDYFNVLSQHKIIYPDITWRPSFSLDPCGSFFSKTVYCLITSDLWVLAVLNSPVGWWLSWRRAIHGKDEALRFHNPFMESFPIPTPTQEALSEAERVVHRLIETSAIMRSSRAEMLDWLSVQHGVIDPSTKLQDPSSLASNAFVAEVQKARGKKNPLTASGLHSLREEYARTIEPARLLAGESMQLERRLHDLINSAYGLTTEEVSLMWETAPPRMPISRPAGI